MMLRNLLVLVGAGRGSVMERARERAGGGVAALLLLLGVFIDIAAHRTPPHRTRTPTPAQRAEPACSALSLGSWDARAAVARTAAGSG
jgi:hypothetical protein